MAYYRGTLKTHSPADDFLDAAYSMSKLFINVLDLVFAAAFTILALVSFLDVATTYIVIEFAGGFETGRLGMFLWNISMNRYDFYGMTWTWSVVYLIGLLVVALPFSPLFSGWLRRSLGDVLADLFDVFRMVVVFLLIAYVTWEITAYVQIIPQIGISAETLLKLIHGGG